MSPFCIQCHSLVSRSYVQSYVSIFHHITPRVVLPHNNVACSRSYRHTSTSSHHGTFLSFWTQKPLSLSVLIAINILPPSIVSRRNVVLLLTHNAGLGLTRKSAYSTIHPTLHVVFPPHFVLLQIHTYNQRHPRSQTSV